jgi:hypothetical protein
MYEGTKHHVNKYVGIRAWKFYRTCVFVLLAVVNAHAKSFARFAGKEDGSYIEGNMTLS